MAKTFVIGDIHGALRALEQLIGRINPGKDDRLIFLGDYVDGWSQSAQVIDYLIGLEAVQPCLFIRGNHDTWCEGWLKGNKTDDRWLAHGGLATISSYAGYSEEQKQRHLAFFNSMLLYYVEEPAYRLFIHAGFAAMKGPGNESSASNYSWDRTLWEMALAMDTSIPKDSKRYPKRLSLYREIYIGHTPTTNYGVGEPMNAANVWNIDTGAAFLGRISALQTDTKACWQSDIVQTLYPDERGRNG